MERQEQNFTTEGTEDTEVEPLPASVHSVLSVVQSRDSGFRPRATPEQTTAGDEANEGWRRRRATRRCDRTAGPRVRAAAPPAAFGASETSSAESRSSLALAAHRVSASCTRPPRNHIVCPAMKSAKIARALRLPSTYAPWLAALKARVSSAQLIAAARVNHELLRLYWEIGTALIDAQDREGWGAAIIPRLARDLHAEFPEMQGFSVRNLKYMLRFARENGAPPKVQQAAALLSGDTNSVTIVAPPAAQLHAAAPSIVQQPAALLPWGHHLLLMDKVKDRAARAWYMQAAVDNGWSRSVLAVQIAQRAHRRAGKAVTNFAATLPPPQSDLAQQTLRDTYVFDSEPSRKTVLYLSAVDDRLRHRDDQPSIGLLLCRGKNRLTVEYALRDVKKPIGVAEWRTRLVASLPKALRSSLPSVAEIEAELGPRPTKRENHEPR